MPTAFDPGLPVAACPVGRVAARAVRGVGLLLRQPEAVLPEVEDSWSSVVETLAEHPSALAALDGQRRARGAASRLREGAGRPRPLVDDRAPGAFRMTAVLPTRPVGGRLIDQFEYGLDAPICLTWELTYACNLACVHCLSSSGRRDPRELSTAEAEAVIDELQRMQVFYVNVGGGEPTVRPDFWHLLDYAIGHDVGVKFSTNGVKLDKTRAAQLARTDYVDVQISLDGATAEVNDRRARHRLLRDGHPGAGEPGRGRDEGLQGLRRRHPRERRAARRVQGAHRLLRRPAADHPAAARRAAGPTSGTSCTRRRPSSATSTTGCWPTATTCSPATRSSTSRRSVRRCPG